MVVQFAISGKNRTTDIEPDTSSSPHLKEAMQVFTFANVLRRPIVVLSNFENIRGVYLPLIFDSAICVKHPLVLVYDNGRFVPLVGAACEPDVNRELDYVPLVTSELEPLRVWFLLEDEENLASDLESRYMNLREIPMPNINNFVVVAQLEFRDLNLDLISTGSVESAGVVNEIGRAVVYPFQKFYLDPTAPPASIQASNEHLRLGMYSIHLFKFVFVSLNKLLSITSRTASLAKATKTCQRLKNIIGSRRKFNLYHLVKS
jgi:OTU-like cysteine protease